MTLTEPIPCSNTMGGSTRSLEPSAENLVRRTP